MKTSYYFDTDILTLYLHQHPQVVRHILQHFQDDLAITVISYDEIFFGWLTALRKARKPQQAALFYDRLTQTIDELRSWRVVSFGIAAINRFTQLRGLRLNIGKNDLRIAAIALDARAVVVTRNLRDFQRIPGLVSEDWSI